MHKGAFALLDALGYRGIWRRHKARVVLTKMQTLRKAALDGLEHATDLLREKIDVRVTGRIALLSDTLVVGVWSKGAKPTQLAKVAAVLAAAHVASEVSSRSVESVPRLAFRGCITFGKYDFVKQFIIGEAVDEAAEHYERADAAVVWLAPSAKSVVTGAVREKAIGESRTAVIARFSVPIKQRGFYRTFAVNPFVETDGKAERDTIRRNVMASFDDNRLDVQIKRQNTARMLDEVTKYLDAMENIADMRRKREQRRAEREPTGLPPSEDAKK